MEPRRATLASMGLRSKRAVAKHILEEITWESNLIPDIASLDYLAGHQEQTNLQPLEGLPPFADVYVYGPLRNNEIVWVRGGFGGFGQDSSIEDLSCCAGSLEQKPVRFHRTHSCQKLPQQPHTRDGTANRGRRRAPCQVEVAGDLPRRGSSRILRCQGGRLGAGAGSAAARTTCHAAPAGGDRFRPVPDRLHAGLRGNSGPGGIGAAFEEQAWVCPPRGVRFPDAGGRISDNIDSVGGHVCTFVQTRNGRRTATKFYNKDISQIEAGKIRESFGGHLAHLVDSTNRHLR